MSDDALENTAHALLSLILGISLVITRLVVPVPVFIYQVFLSFCRALYHLIYQLTYTPRRESFAHERLDRLPRAKDDYPGEPYEYDPTAGSRSIRLLELKYPNPGDLKTDGIECRLIHVRLDKSM